MRWLSAAECSVASLTEEWREQRAAQQGIAADQQQLGSIDLGCRLAIRRASDPFRSRRVGTTGKQIVHEGAG